MYAWYKEAQVCYVYLDDVEHLSDMQSCRWLSRGWTLQELIAPMEVRFYGRDWGFLGTKSSLLDKLVEWTNIDQVVLEDGFSVRYISAATRMSWAASRKTTRVEDMAYCLLGIFGVNMPLIYGERQKAFVRLQEEILRQTRDHSLLAFDRSHHQPGENNLLAYSPEFFSLTPKIILNDSRFEDRRYCEVTSKGIVLESQLVKDKGGNICYAALGCRFEFNHSGKIALPVVEHQWPATSKHSFSVIEEAGLTIIKPHQLENVPLERVLIVNRWFLDPYKLPCFARRYVCCLHADALITHGYDVAYVQPDTGVRSWDRAQLCSEIQTSCDYPIVRRFAFFHKEHCEAFIVSLAELPCDNLNSEIYMNVKLKPANLDCETWFAEEQVYSVLQSSDDRYALEMLGPSSQSIAGALWICINRDLRYGAPAKLHPYDSLQLLSNTCISNVTISAKEDPFDKWNLMLVPSDDCHSIKMGEEKLVRPKTKMRKLK